jgi:diguanylate cyclase (GGDEF)-like protein
MRLLMRLYVGAVIVAGGALLVASVPRGAFAHPLLLGAFVAASIVFHMLKFDLLVASASSTLSIGYVVTFIALLVLGPAATTWVTMAGGWAQCTLRARQRNPWYRTAFSMSALALSMEGAGQTLRLTGGTNLTAPADIVVPALVAAALVYFVINSALMAIALGLSTGRSPLHVWDTDFMWSAPSYFIGALVATVAVQGVSRFGVASVVLLIAPVFLTYRLYKVALERVQAMSREQRELHAQYTRAQVESQTDPLTQLPNRRFLAEHGPAEIARAARTGEPVAFLLIDVDRFKQINDTHGHQKGDEALMLIADCLRRGLRPYDACGRYAGDEFVLVLSACGTELAGRRAHELIESVRALQFDVGEAGDWPLSTSVGVAVYPIDGDSYPELLAVADTRMYENKAGARDMST